MFRKPTPIKLSDTVKAAIDSQLNTQVIQKASKSSDPKFPVFEVPVNKKVLVYVPNHVVDAEGGPELRMDKPLIHSIHEGGKRYSYYRCISGIILDDENGNSIYDGSCPLCEGTSVPWDLANTKILQKCKQMGLDPNDKENTQVKSIRSTEFSGRVIKEPNRFYTFPIVVINTVNEDGKTIAKGDNGKPICTPMWYHISEAQYIKKWEACFEGMEDEPIHPGGHFFTLNYTYDTKNKEPNKMLSAQNLTVIARNISGTDNLKTFLDKATVDWTPEKARETVISNQLYSKEDLNSIVDDVLEEPIAMLSLLKASEMTDDDSNNSGFKLQAPTSKTDNVSSNVPEMDETDQDLDIE